MAKIDVAYSLEIYKNVDAMEANELWLEGVLQNKRAFKCIDENCNAGITCKNMDTFANNRKVIPHFIMSDRKNMHSVSCEINKQLEEERSKKAENKGENTRLRISKKVRFHMERPERHRIIQRNIIGNRTSSMVNIKAAKERAIETRKGYTSNYYQLNSLILYYVDAYKRGRTEQETVEIDFGGNKKYTYSLSNLFKRIKYHNEVTDKDRNHYVYYGKGKIFSRRDGGYDLVFSENFHGSKRRVKCVLNQTKLGSCLYGKANKMEILNSSIGEERFIYVLSKKNVSDNYNTVFLNVNSMDCIAISEIDLDNIEDK